ncbi:MAG: hypothetical protein HY401_05170 [Elusimicrobia bacterium]|nr:hypothetical protein [Elusimicrobiota bacterium]
MFLVLDTNEYLFALGSRRAPSSVELLEKIAANPERFEIRICRSILNEIRENSIPQRFRELWNFLNLLGITLDEDWDVPFEIVAKYEALGLKQGDAFVAGYTEYVGAQCLITENRKDFLAHPGWFPFKVLNAETFLKQFI